MNEACEAQARALQLPRLLAKVWNNIGEAARYLGDEQRARHAYLESARAFCQVHEWGAAHFPFWNLACLYGSWEEFDLAVPTLACAHRLWEALNHPPDPDDAQTIQTLKAHAAASLGAELVEYLWHQGRQAPPEQLLQQLDARLPQKR